METVSGDYSKSLDLKEKREISCSYREGMVQCLGRFFPYYRIYMFNAEDLENIGESKVFHKPEIITGNILAFNSLDHHCLIQHTHTHFYKNVIKPFILFSILLSSSLLLCFLVLSCLLSPSLLFPSLPFLFLLLSSFLFPPTPPHTSFCAVEM